MKNQSKNSPTLTDLAAGLQTALDVTAESERALEAANKAEETAGAAYDAAKLAYDAAGRDVDEKEKAFTENRLRAGRLLIEAKDLCPSGQWEKWLAKNVKVSATTAREYMRIAGAADPVKAEADHKKGTRERVAKHRAQKAASGGKVSAISPSAQPAAISRGAMLNAQPIIALDDSKPAGPNPSIPVEPLPEADPVATAKRCVEKMTDEQLDEFCGWFRMRVGIVTDGDFTKRETKKREARKVQTLSAPPPPPAPKKVELPTVTIGLQEPPKKATPAPAPAAAPTLLPSIPPTLQAQINPRVETRRAGFFAMGKDERTGAWNHITLAQPRPTPCKWLDAYESEQEPMQLAIRSAIINTEGATDVRQD